MRYREKMGGGVSQENENDEMIIRVRKCILWDERGLSESRITLRAG